MSPTVERLARSAFNFSVSKTNNGLLITYNQLMGRGSGSETSILYGKTPVRAASKIRWWVCGNGHVFSYGDQEWHFEFDQQHSKKYPTPMYCASEETLSVPEDMGGGEEPCDDSSYLWGPFDTRTEASEQIDQLMASKF